MPKPYHAQLRWGDFESGTTLLVLFRHDREDVILSRMVRRAMESAGEILEPNRLAVGGDFTEEALRMLRDAGFRIARLGDWFWTDESYRRITDASV